MPLLRRRAVFAAKVEATVGTAESITASEGAFNARDFSIQPTVAVTRREGQGGFNHIAGIPEGMMGTCSIVHDLSYDGTTIPTWASVLLPACGWVDTSGTFSPVSQGPGSGGVKTLTLAHYKDGKRSLLSGAMGTFKISCPTGKMGQLIVRLFGVSPAGVFMKNDMNQTLPFYLTDYLKHQLERRINLNVLRANGLVPN